ncbi:hypothetical protein C2E23DRAFT_887297 [Lenzites betulinus]|nr:hypothetical protein C2E23DRAFT_887297 [Lenzites betulinus]
MARHSDGSLLRGSDSRQGSYARRFGTPRDSAESKGSTGSTGMLDRAASHARNERVRFKEPSREGAQSGPAAAAALGPNAWAEGLEGFGESASSRRGLGRRELDPRLALPSEMFGLPSVARQSVNPVDVVTSVAAGAAHHQDALLVQLCRNIQFKVGHLRPKLPDGVKQPKIDSPRKYKGDNDHKVFYLWLDDYLSWLRAYNLGGPDTDEDRVRLTRSYLEGEAEEWFAQTIDHPEVRYRPTFEETICAMHRRFVHATSAAKATQEYEAVKYVPATGVDGFVAALRDCARMMVVPPSEYDITHRLVKGLPTDIYRMLVVHRGIQPEYVGLDTVPGSPRTGSGPVQLPLGDLNRNDALVIMIIDECATVRQY